MKCQVLVAFSILVGVIVSQLTMVPDWRPCTYRVSEVNCNSRKPAQELWSGGQHHPYIELEAQCPGSPTGFSPKHTMYGLHLVIWDYERQESRMVIPLGEKGMNPLAGGQFVVISRDSRSPPWNLYGTGWTFSDGWRDNVEVVLPVNISGDIDALPYIQYLPADNFFGAVILYQSRVFSKRSCAMSTRPWLCHHSAALPFSTTDLEVSELLDFVPVRCGESKIPPSHTSMIVITDVTNAKLDTSISRVKTNGNWTMFRRSIPTPGSKNVLLSDYQDCYYRRSGKPRMSCVLTEDTPTSVQRQSKRRLDVADKERKVNRSNELTMSLYGPFFRRNHHDRTVTSTTTTTTYKLGNDYTEATTPTSSTFRSSTLSQERIVSTNKPTSTVTTARSRTSITTTPSRTASKRTSEQSTTRSSSGTTISGSSKTSTPWDKFQKTTLSKSNGMSTTRPPKKNPLLDTVKDAVNNAINSALGTLAASLGSQIGAAAGAAASSSLGAAIGAALGAIGGTFAALGGAITAGTGLGKFLSGAGGIVNTNGPNNNHDGDVIIFHPNTSLDIFLLDLANKAKQKARLALVNNFLGKERTNEGSHLELSAVPNYLGSPRKNPNVMDTDELVVEVVRPDIADHLSDDYRKNPNEQAVRQLLEYDPMHPPQTFIDELNSNKALGESNFQRDWLRKHNYLEYSISKKGAYCRYCSMGFAVGSNRPYEGTHLVHVPLNMQKSVNQRRTLTDHPKSKYHIDAVKQAQQMRPDDLVIPAEIQQYQESVSSDREIENKQTKLIQRNGYVAIAEVMIVLGRKGLPFGDTDSKKSLHTKLKFIDGNELFRDNLWGLNNFATLLLLRLKAGDKALLEHFQKRTKRRWGVHPYVRDHLLSLAADLIRKEIFDQIRSSDFIGLILDGTIDISKRDQMTVVVRYTYQNQDWERFLVFLDISRKATGESMYQSVVTYFTSMKVDMTKVRAQTYDAGSSLAGQIMGVHGRLLKDNPRAVYVYCFAHAINRVVVRMVTLEVFHNMRSQITAISNFFAVPRRRTILRDAVQACGSCQGKRKKQVPRRPSETRWSDLANTVDDIIRLFHPLRTALKQISKDEANFDAKYRSQARDLRAQMVHFNIVLTLMVSRDVLGSLRDLTIYLQSPRLTYFEGLTEVRRVQSTLDDWRVDAGGQHAKWWTETLQLLKDVRITPQVPDVMNPTPEQIFEHRRMAITVPYLTEVVNLLKARFDQRATYIAMLGELVPAVLIKTSVTAFGFRELYAVYEEDLIKDENRPFHQEIDDWIEYWLKQETRPETVSETVACLGGDLGVRFPNIKILLAILRVIPATSATAERSFSTLRLELTHTRSTLRQEKLNDLTILNIHKDIPVDPVEVVTQHFTTHRSEDDDSATDSRYVTWSDVLGNDNESAAEEAEDEDVITLAEEDDDEMIEEDADHIKLPTFDF